MGLTLSTEPVIPDVRCRKTPNLNNDLRMCSDPETFDDYEPEALYNPKLRDLLASRWTVSHINVDVCPPALPKWKPQDFAWCSRTFP